MGFNCTREASPYYSDIEPEMLRKLLFTLTTAGLCAASRFTPAKTRQTSDVKYIFSLYVSSID
jgi:ketopantoate reductase